MLCSLSHKVLQELSPQIEIIHVLPVHCGAFIAHEVYYYFCTPLVIKNIVLLLNPDSRKKYKKKKKNTVSSLALNCQSHYWGRNEFKLLTAFSFWIAPNMSSWAEIAFSELMRTLQLSHLQVLKTVSRSQTYLRQASGDNKLKE